MTRRPSYSLDTSWVDPFEPRVENRSSDRFPFSLKVSIAVEDPTQKGQLIGPGIIRDISQSGVSLITKHQLTPRQRVTVALPTEGCHEDMCLPKAFIGRAEVCRTEPGDGSKSTVALRFGDSLCHNIEFVIFLDYLRFVSRTSATTKS